MAALTADKELEAIDPGGLRRMKLGASKTIYKGSMVVVDTTTGLVEAGTEAANKIFVGIATHGAVSGASDTVWVVLQTSGMFKLTGSSLEQADVGKHVVLLDDQTVTDDAGTATANIPVGILVELNSATEGWVELRSFGSPASTIAA